MDCLFPFYSMQSARKIDLSVCRMNQACKRFSLFGIKPGFVQTRCVFLPPFPQNSVLQAYRKISKLFPADPVCASILLDRKSVV